MYLPVENAVKEYISCKITINNMKIKTKGDCSFVVNKESRDQAIKFNDKIFSICKNSKIDESNAENNCKAITLAKSKDQNYKIVKVQKVILKALKQIVKLAIKANPGNNDKTIKSKFKEILKNNLVGLIVKGNKTISRIKKITLRRIDHKLRITIVFRRYQRIIDENEQIYRRIKNKKYVTTNCSLYIDRDLKINCS